MMCVGISCSVVSDFLQPHGLQPTRLLCLLDFPGKNTGAGSHFLLQGVFPDSLVGKESACHAGDPGSIPGSGRSPVEGIGYPLQYSWASLVAQLVKNLPAMREIWVQSLGREDPLQKGKATHSNILAWRIPWCIVRGVTELDMTEQPSLSLQYRDNWSTPERGQYLKKQCRKYFQIWWKLYCHRSKELHEPQVG